MEDKELSQWFDINEQKPWEPGVYEVSSSRSWSPLTYSSYWCGEKFHGEWGFPEEALENKDHPGDGCGAKWRGLASDPSAKPKPKARGNRKVTRYVVMDKTQIDTPLGVFSCPVVAANHAAKFKWAEVEKIRFRTPEA